MFPLALDDILELPDYVVGLFFFTPIVIGLFIYFYGTRHVRSWKKGIYPPKLKFSEDNLLEAYLSLGARMILLEYANSKGKSHYINEYFKRYFPKANYNFGDSLLFSMRHPIKVETVCDWLNEHLVDEGARAQVVYFLTGMVVHEGKVNKKELQFLMVINKLLGLNEKNLDRIIATYSSYQRTWEKEKSRKKEVPKVNLREQYKKVLGLSTDVTKDEIKKAYRKLVKLHHPDVFANASDAQKKLAEEQFIEIQTAYEYLMDKQ